MAPERAIASMPVVISAVPIRNRRSVPEQKASAKAARIEYSMIKPPMRTCSSMQSSYDVVSSNRNELAGSVVTEPEENTGAEAAAAATQAASGEAAE